MQSTSIQHYPCETSEKVCKTPSGLKLHVLKKHKNPSDDENEKYITLDLLEALIVQACNDFIPTLD